MLEITGLKGWRRLELQAAELGFYHHHQNHLDTNMFFGSFQAQMPGRPDGAGLAINPVATEPVRNGAPENYGVLPGINHVAAQTQRMPENPYVNPAVNHVLTAPAQSNSNLNKKPPPPDMDLAICHIAIAYFFQLGLQLKDICDRRLRCRT